MFIIIIKSGLYSQINLDGNKFLEKQKKITQDVIALLAIGDLDKVYNYFDTKTTKQLKTKIDIVSKEIVKIRSIAYPLSSIVIKEKKIEIKYWFHGLKSDTICYYNVNFFFIKNDSTLKIKSLVCKNKLEIEQEFQKK